MELYVVANSARRECRTIIIFMLSAILLLHRDWPPIYTEAAPLPRSSARTEGVRGISTTVKRWLEVISYLPLTFFNYPNILTVRGDLRRSPRTLQKSFASHHLLGKVVFILKWRLLLLLVSVSVY